MHFGWNYISILAALEQLTASNGAGEAALMPLRPNPPLLQATLWLSS